MIKAYWCKSKNFGDTLTPIIIKHFTGQEAELIDVESWGKLIAVGSLLGVVRQNDIIWGTGSIEAMEKGAIKQPIGSTFLAVRGPLTREIIDGEVPEVYGDPAILLPLIYNPDIPKKHKVGVIPHYVDKKLVADKDMHFIDVEAPWKEVVDEIKSCEMIISSSLHGIICAEAYGIPVKWVKYSDKIAGGEFKFQDYFLGSGRKEQEYFKDIAPIENLKEKQEALLRPLQDYYKYI